MVHVYHHNQPLSPWKEVYQFAGKTLVQDVGHHLMSQRVPCSVSTQFYGT